jgi:hypothetical protein
MSAASLLSNHDNSVGIQNPLLHACLSFVGKIRDVRQGALVRAVREGRSWWALQVFLNQLGLNQDALSYLHQDRKEGLPEVRGSVIAPIA